MPKQINYCKVEDCETRCHGNGLCVRHYKQVYRHGKVFTTIYEPRKAILRKNDALIPLGVEAKDGYAIVDREYAYLDKHKWVLVDGYAKTTPNRSGTVGMHRYILGDKTGFEIDHKNGNPLDNRKDNLRHCTHHQNTLNARGKRSNEYKGIYLHSNGKKFAAQISFRGRTYYLGLFIDEKEAALAYDKKAKELHGKFARLNFTEGGVV